MIEYTVEADGSLHALYEDGVRADFGNVYEGALKATFGRASDGTLHMCILSEDDLRSIESALHERQRPE